jgi:PAS domain S-box-containing protein
VLEPYSLFLLVLLYLVFLFLVAYYAEWREKSGRSLVSNAYVYSLSLAVYCTSWTFYGSVGKAATSGLSFLPIYLGPTLIAVLWPIVLRKIVRISKANRITTISDFIGSRYGKSLVLPAIVTAIAVFGIIPYVGLQIKAIMTTFTIMTGGEGAGAAVGLPITLILGLFTIVFGARQLVSSERHSGLVCAVAVESVVKLASFLIVGFFVAFVLFQGPGDIFGQIRNSPYSRLLALGPEGATPYTEWFALLILSMGAIMFLPRQFHMAVVENSDESHIGKASWLFPLYLFAINIFVLPIALGGLLSSGSQAGADYFVLTLPFQQGQIFLSLLAFIGGFSAAAGMVMVEVLALSTMVTNSIAIPSLMWFHDRPWFPRVILSIKRSVILLIVFLGYLFATFFGEFYTLVDMGLQSFEIVTVFVPAFILGLYWKGGNKKGAVAGMAAGFLVLLYTLMVPLLMKAGIAKPGGIIATTAGMEFLNPEALFGVRGLGTWSHALFWSMLANVVLYVGVSVVTGRSKSEETQSLVFVESYQEAGGTGASSSYRLEDIESILGRYLGQQEARDAVEQFLRDRNMRRESLTARDLFDLRNEAERILSGAVGAPIASIILENRIVLTEKEREELSESVRNISESLSLSRQELATANRELNYLKAFRENIIESAPIGIATVSAGYTVEYWNREMELITGIGRSEARGTPINVVLPWVSRENLTEDNQKERTFQTGDFRTIKVVISPFKDPSGGLVIILEDITETKRLERERKNILSMFAHDMKNPVVVSGGFLARLLSGKAGLLSDKQKSYLELVKDELSRLQELIADFLEFSRFEAKECRPLRSPCSLAAALRRHIAAARVEAEKKDILLNLEMGSVPPEIGADPAMIDRVIVNLLDNAIKYTGQGGSVTLRLVNREKDIMVQVADTGPGIGEEHLPYLFDAFYRVSRDTKGSGLGLSIAKTIIDAHGGRIWVESTPGTGSVFTFVLPKKAE